MKVTRTKNLQAQKALDGIIAIGRVQGKVGWFKSAIYPSGVPVALVAAVNEFGWPEHNIPPRLGMRATAEACKAPWAAVAASVAHKLAKGQLTPEQAMEIITAKAAGDVRKHITEVREPPLKQSTIDRRIHGRKVGNSVTASKPLVNTGLLLNTLTNQVEKK